MSATVPVQAAWDDLVRRRVHAGAAADAVLAELVRTYGEPHRHYHTLDHIAALLRLLEQHGALVADRDAIQLAIRFHDAVYDPAPPSAAGSGMFSALRSIVSRSHAARPDESYDAAPLAIA